MRTGRNRANPQPKKKQKPIEYLTPEYQDNLSFPLRLVIPATLARQTKLPRNMVILSENTRLPKQLHQWMNADSRYSQWFK